MNKAGIQLFAELVRDDQMQTCKNRFPDTFDTIHKQSWQVEVIPGRKYTKVNVGGSGKFMIDDQCNIYGIKGYGKINKTHYYGTLATRFDWFWGEYTPYKGR